MRWGIQVCFLAELGDQQVTLSSKIGTHQGRQLCHGFVSAGDALGQERPATPMLSFLAGRPGASDLIRIYNWGGLCSVVPMGGGPCSAVLRHLRVVNVLVCV